MKIAAWNLNNRVGKVPFRLEAAAAAIAVGADIFVFNEYYPQSHGQAFQAELESAGWVHQAISVQTDEKANRVLIASKNPIAPLPRATPSGSSYFGRDGKTSTIDHLLSTSECLIADPKYITKINQHCLAGSTGSISDHAILVANINKT